MRKFLVMLLLLAVTIPTASAYDASTPYTVTMNFIIPSDTAFSVSLAGAESTIDFNPANKDSKDVEPDSQVASASTPIAVITNDGNVAQNFSINLTLSKPSWVVVRADDTNVAATATAFDTTPLEDSGWQDVSPAASVDIYMWANFTTAVGGTTARTFQVNTAEA